MEQTRHQFFILVNMQVMAKIICSVWDQIYCSSCSSSSLCSKSWRNIDKEVSPLFSEIATLYFCMRYPAIILRPYAGTSSLKNKQFYRSILWKRCPENSYIRFKKMTMKELLHEGVPLKGLLKLNTSQVILIYFFSWNIYFQRAPPMLL